MGVAPVERTSGVTRGREYHRKRWESTHNAASRPLSCEPTHPNWPGSLQRGRAAVGGSGWPPGAFAAPRSAAPGADASSPLVAPPSLPVVGASVCKRPDHGLSNGFLRFPLGNGWKGIAHPRGGPVCGCRIRHFMGGVKVCC
ncbi:hypothetical protein DEH69_17865 [Streptomyces sp. PT12]|nr:hypothetical protein DEH69_17865 [Streptomyces sp. PT12]